MRELDRDQPMTPQQHAERLDGKRPRILDRMKVPKGWVVDGKLPDGIWENINAAALPLTPGGPNALDKTTAEEYLQKTRKQYGERAFLLVLPDDEAFGRSARPVLPEDLKRNPDEVLDEAKEAFTQGDWFRSDMLRHAYMAMTGHADTK